MATVICRRLRGGVYRTSTFSAAVKLAHKKLPNDHGNAYTLHILENEHVEPDRNGLNPTLYNPGAYAGLKKYNRSATESYEVNTLHSDYTRSNAKQIQNTYSIMSSRSLSSAKNNILDFAFSSPVTSQARLPDNTKPQLKNEAEPKLDGYEAEIYSTKEDPRRFQQDRDRPEYKSLCYSNSTQNVCTSVEEGQHLLKQVTFLKSSLTPGVIADYFDKLGHLPDDQMESVRADTKFAMLCRYSIENLQQYSHAELIGILKAFVRLEIPATHSMFSVYEVEFCRRVWNMSTNDLLLVADMWRYLGRSVPRYLEILYSYMELRWKDLNLPQLIQLIYIIGEGRKAPRELMQKLESMVLRHLDSLNLEEIGAVCLGFFKSHNGLSEHLMRKIGDKVSDGMDDISNYALVNVLKMFRFTHVDHLVFLKRLGQIAPGRIPSMGSQGIMHIALSCAALHYLDENVMNAVAATIPDRVAYCRSKDLAKLLWSFGALNYQPPNADQFYATLTSQIRNKLGEFEKFPEHFLTCLLGLVFAKYYPLDLIEFALSEKFVKLATKESLFELKKDLFTLDGSVEIECPEYTGNHLSMELRQEVTEMLQSFSRQDICIKPEVLEAATLIESMLGGPQYVKNHMILPHTRSNDLEVHLDVGEKPIPINVDTVGSPSVSSELKPMGIQITEDLLDQLLDSNRKTVLHKDVEKPKLETGQRRVASSVPKDYTKLLNPDFSSGVPITDNLISMLAMSRALPEKPLCKPKARADAFKLAIQVSNRNHYCYASRHLLGLHNLKRRQLQKLGYVVVELPYWEWFPLLKRTRSEKLAYLHQKIFSSVDYLRG
ncbi:hypothetical protein XENTR_v10000143 [Xenopus tropicalis]|uniref:FAST kinase domain-containing protein 5, mitochondrial n=1 Tax=Xenopus tropicalis TaxID=8364 RepID=A0A803K3H8_XENTR|nr:FAST kinase domain-containing protein 5, mitochondrial [Xenopus tropicalis]XP_012811244.2 FAST kinase domain-containing protein 5, mitochondrial [Xenopus tropicalis]XP_031751108.1 FAST kinase domain-containing protein 5, mitochondrial [Xenopus tropicalis]XP_031751109.1 FAST kinase domain-containing protein 5, mitochondrial [Xenopus tropicalis]KAE8628624.1 hypothetical protein XENTR_v10000143 [Xenopus tropicalis]